MWHCRKDSPLNLRRRRAMADQQLEREEEERYEQIDRVLDKADDDNSDADADEQGEDQRSGPKRERQ